MRGKTDYNAEKCWKVKTKKEVIGLLGEAEGKRCS